MKIVLITNLNNGSENDRLTQEALKLGHEISFVKPEDITISIIDNRLHYPEICDLQPDIVVLRGILHSIRKVVSLVEHMRKDGIKVFDNNLTQMQYSIDKVSDLTKLALKNIPLVNSEYSTQYDQFPTMAAAIGYPFIIKPVNTGKGIGVTKIENKNQLQAYIKDRKANNWHAKTLLMQQFIPYEHDLRILVIGNHTFTMRRVPAKGEFRANYSLGGAVELFEPKKQTKTLAIKALNSINMSIGGVDILITKDSHEYILEVNHSPGFEGMEKATDQNIAKIFLTHAIKEAK